MQTPAFTVNEIDLFEVNEAFAAQALAVARELGLPQDRTNPERQPGSRSATRSAPPAPSWSSRRCTSCSRTSSRHALVTMCIGGGQGIAAIFERV